MKKRHLILITLITIASPAFSQTRIEPSLSLSAGPSISAETGLGFLPHGSFSADLGVSIGEAWGAIVRAGAFYQMATAYSASWYRYRGFFGLELAAGPRYESSSFDAYAVGGGSLARYDNSYSYFFFPFVELGASLPVATIGRHFGLTAGLALPARFRADAFTIGLRATVALIFEPTRASRGAIVVTTEEAK